MSGFIRNLKILLIINPIAGRMSVKDELLTVIDILCRHGNNVNVYTTSDKGDAESVVLTQATGNDMIICCGGDGTFNEVISGCMKLPGNAKMPLIGYIPSGTANDLAATLKLSSDIKTAVRDIVNGESFLIDIGSFNDKFFTYIASFGIFTKTSYATPQFLKNTFGHFAYIIEGMRDLSNIRPYHMSVKSDSIVNEIEDDFIFGCVTNTTSIGGIIKLSDTKISLNDGIFETVLIKNPLNPVEFNNLIFNIGRQDFQNDRNIIFTRASHIEFNINEPIPWTIDGEFAGDYDNVKIRNLPEAVTIIKSNTQEYR